MGDAHQDSVDTSISMVGSIILASPLGANEGAWQRGVEPTVAEGGVGILVLPGDGLGRLGGLSRVGRVGGISVSLAVAIKDVECDRGAGWPWGATGGATGRTGRTLAGLGDSGGGQQGDTGWTGRHGDTGRDTGRHWDGNWGAQDAGGGQETLRGH